MRRPNFYRAMNMKEERYAYEVFWGTLPPGNQIGFGDGLGMGDRPWTDKGHDSNSLMPLMKYQINMGDMASMDLTSTSYFGGFGRVCDTFIHELTHVWQYRHGDWVKASSIAAQALETVTTKLVISKTGARYVVTNDAYEYRPLDFDKSWNDYNAEQQAHIVEDWNNHGRNKNDPLYPFITEVIRSNGDPKASKQSLADLRKHLYFPTPPEFIRVASLDSVLVPILEKRFTPNDVVGFGGRVQQLEQIFRGANPLQAQPLLDRLTYRRNGDKISMYFYDHLSTATRVNLLGILRGSAKGGAM